ncbi:Sterile alpha motif domain-containing protein 11 [Bagarius yarrelli]|uniref:Sterile alpha motif domain-containing protein 11 n=1 Tax=Bagarius yarrelli TaxID=175774 RepID=A0A556TZR3_BAGYA|nr:Sterile alpha motif domain-containing protein 11 [Bagarius yarrelli]
MVSSSESRPLAPPLPPHSAVLTGRAFSSAGGYSFLPADTMETVARRQEILHKQNIARMEMNAILQQKELENQQKTLLSNMENPLVYQHLPQSSPALFRGRHRLHDNNDIFDLHANNFLMSSPYPPISTLQRERGRRPGRRAANQKLSDSGTTFHSEKIQPEEKNVYGSPGGASGEEKEPESEGRVEISSEANVNTKHQLAKAELAGKKSFRNGDESKVCIGAQTGCTHTDASNIDVTNGNKDMGRFLFSHTTPLSYMYPLGGNTLLPPETLPLLTEDHLLDTLGLKLGPALKIRSQVLKRMGGAFYMAAPPLTAPLLQPPLEKHLERSCDVISSLTHSTELIQSPKVGECEAFRPSAGNTPTSKTDTS